MKNENPDLLPQQNNFFRSKGNPHFQLHSTSIFLYTFQCCFAIHCQLNQSDTNMLNGNYHVINTVIILDGSLSHRHYFTRTERKIQQMRKDQL